MPGLPFDTKNNFLIPIPIFNGIKSDNIQDKYNKTFLRIQMLGRVTKDRLQWQISKCYLPCTYYPLFADFQLAFVKCVNETIKKMFEEANAHPTIYELLKIKLSDFNVFSEAATPSKSVWVFLHEFQWTH